MCQNQIKKVLKGWQDIKNKSRKIMKPIKLQLLNQIISYQNERWGNKSVNKNKIQSMRLVQNLLSVKNLITTSHNLLLARSKDYLYLIWSLKTILRILQSLKKIKLTKYWLLIRNIQKMKKQENMPQKIIQPIKIKITK